MCQVLNRMFTWTDLHNDPDASVGSLRFFFSNYWTVIVNKKRYICFILVDFCNIFKSKFQSVFPPVHSLKGRLWRVLTTCGFCLYRRETSEYDTVVNAASFLESLKLTTQEQIFSSSSCMKSNVYYIAGANDLNVTCNWTLSSFCAQLNDFITK